MAKAPVRYQKAGQGPYPHQLVCLIIEPRTLHKRNIKWVLKAPLHLPTIDFSQIRKHDVLVEPLGYDALLLDKGSVMWVSVKAQVLNAFQEYGCFEASFNEISTDLRNSVFSSLKQLFDLPLETKLRNIPDKLVNGYVGQNKNAPLYESLGIEDLESFTNIMWPHGNPKFSNSIHNYIHNLGKLDQIVRMMVLESLDLEKYLDEHMELTDYLLRVMTYRVPEENESNVGLNGHTDKNILTILHQNEVGELEVQKEGEEWIKVKVSPNCFVVMAGETFNIWTNGRLRAAIHRVVINGEGTRFSIGLFSIPKWGKFIKAPQEMVDEEHPLLFKPFDYGEFLKFYFKKENIGNKFVMKEYCGVSF